ncbi:hypothetical protein DYH09_32670 [bacterium CPR1]|nr:hypothetical protein [bacterium CPR1]
MIGSDFRAFDTICGPYSKVSLLGSIGALLLRPENAPFEVRLGFLANRCLETELPSSRAIRSKELRTLVCDQMERYFPNVLVMEDPAENLYVRQLRLEGTTWAFLPGLSEGVAVDFQAFLCALEVLEGAGEFRERAMRLARSILSLSDAILSRAGLGRSDLGNPFPGPFDVPGDGELERLRNCLAFSRAELSEILDTNRLTLGDIQPLLCQLQEPPFTDPSGAHLGHLDFRPIVECSPDQFIVPVPSGLVHGLRKLLITESLKEGCFQSLALGAADYGVWQISRRSSARWSEPESLAIPGTLGEKARHGRGLT